VATKFSRNSLTDLEGSNKIIHFFLCEQINRFYFLLRANYPFKSKRFTSAWRLIITLYIWDWTWLKNQNRLIGLMEGWITRATSSGKTWANVLITYGDWETKKHFQTAYLETVLTVLILSEHNLKDSRPHTPFRKAKKKPQPLLVTSSRLLWGY